MKIHSMTKSLSYCDLKNGPDLKLSTLMFQEGLSKLFSELVLHNNH